jgi:lysyl-tRNA synthetase class 2
MERVKNLATYLMKRDNITITFPNGTTWDGNSSAWQTLYVPAAIVGFVPHCSYEDLNSLENLRAIAEKNGVYVKDQDNYGKVEEKLLSTFVEPHLISPTFLIGHHISNSPLARTMPGHLANGIRAYRFEAYINGYEIANGYSELNNAIEQKERLEDQVRQLNSGDAEAQPYDESFIYALAGGCPPCCGVGLGLDRLAMVLYGATQIRQVIFFPTMKHKN